MPFICQSFKLVRHIYVIRMSLVCMRMSSLCHSYVLLFYLYVLVCHPHNTRMYTYFIHMSLVRRANRWGRPPLPYFENQKKVAWLCKNCPDCVHLWVKFSIQNVVLEYLGKITPNFFLPDLFSWYFSRIVYKSDLIPQNVPCPKKCLVGRLLVCAHMTTVCHSCVLACHPYATRMWFYHEPFRKYKKRPISIAK